MLLILLQLLTVLIVMVRIYSMLISRAPYLTGTLGAAVHDPVFLVLEQTAVLPAHVLLLSVPHPPQSLLHHRVLLGLRTQTQKRTHARF